MITFLLRKLAIIFYNIPMDTKGLQEYTVQDDV